MNDIISALMDGWAIGASTVRTISVVEKLTAVLDKGNALESLTEVARRLQHYDDIQLLLNKIDTLSDLVRGLNPAAINRRLDEIGAWLHRSDDETRRRFDQLESVMLKGVRDVERAAAIQAIKNDNSEPMDIGDNEEPDFSTTAFFEMATALGITINTNREVVLEKVLEIIRSSRAADAAQAEREDGSYRPY